MREDSTAATLTRRVTRVAFPDMKLCFSTLACPAWDVRQMIDLCVSHRIGGIDFRGIQTQIDTTIAAEFTKELDSTIASLQHNNIALPCFNSSVTLVTPAPLRWQQMLEEAQRTAALSEKTGTRMMRIFGGGIPKEISREEALNLGQRHLRQLVKICKPAGLRPVVETHDDWRSSQHMLELVHEFSPDEVGVLWDIEHTIRVGEAPGDTVQSLARYLQHVHVKDAKLSQEPRVNVLLGEGDLPIRECIQALKAIRYEGWFSLETEKRWRENAPEPEISIPQFAEYMRATDERR